MTAWAWLSSSVHPPRTLIAECATQPSWSSVLIKEEADVILLMADWEEAYILWAKIQIDDSYLGGELPGGNSGRG